MSANGVLFGRDRGRLPGRPKWSKEFGADTEEGREGRVVRQGVLGVFAGSAINPKEKVRLGDKTITLPQYVARMNLQLLKASDFNKRLHERGVEQFVTVQKVCKRSRNEAEVREVLTKMWNQPKKAREIIGELVEKNKDIYEFEKQLEETRGAVEPVTELPD